MSQSADAQAAGPCLRVHRRVLHLSDLRLSAEGADGARAARRALEQLLHDLRFVEGVDLIVVSGDVAADGSSAAYVTARAMIGAWAERLDAHHVYVAGDRDDRGHFSEVLGSGHLSPDGLDVGQPGPSGEDRTWVSTVDDLRVITVDTTVPGAQHGQLSTTQAEWLHGALADAAPGGTVLVLHHPPLSVDSHRHLASISLRNPELLAWAVAGGDLDVILCGQLGTSLGGVLGGVPVWVSPGATTRVDLTAPAHLTRTVRGGGAGVVDLGGPFSPRVHVLWSRDPRAGEQVALVDSESGRAVTDEDERPSSAEAVRGSTPGRIPEGRRAPSAESAATTWPQEIDSSSRSVDPAPVVAHASPVEPDPEVDSDDEEDEDDQETPSLLSWAFEPDPGPTPEAERP